MDNQKEDCRNLMMHKKLRNITVKIINLIFVLKNKIYKEKYKNWK